jgi:hypothetical protein
MSRRDFQVYPFRLALRYTLQDLVPWSLRTRWPFKRYFWQAEDIAHITAEAQEMMRAFGVASPRPHLPRRANPLE